MFILTPNPCPMAHHSSLWPLNQRNQRKRKIGDRVLDKRASGDALILKLILNSA
jgi:hypothetical protein